MSGSTLRSRRSRSKCGQDRDSNVALLGESCYSFPSSLRVSCVSWPTWKSGISCWIRSRFRDDVWQNLMDAPRRVPGVNPWIRVQPRQSHSLHLQKLSDILVPGVPAGPRPDLHASTSTHLIVLWGHTRMKPCLPMHIRSELSLNLSLAENRSRGWWRWQPEQN